MINPEWHLNIPYYDYSNPILIARYEKTMTIAQDILDYRMTVRQVAKEYCIGKSTVSRWIENYLKWLDNDLYHEVKTQLRFHKKNTSAWRRR
jgi:transposase